MLSILTKIPGPTQNFSSQTSADFSLCISENVVAYKIHVAWSWTETDDPQGTVMGKSSVEGPFIKVWAELRTRVIICMASKMSNGGKLNITFGSEVLREDRAWRD